jgi:trimeric autotransporter adhesin
MRRFAAVLAFALSATLPADAQVARIETVAGGGPNNMPALAANLVDPLAVAVDAAGNLYVADAGGARVYKVNPTGVLTVFAGNGSRSFSGDGGPATIAGMSGATGVGLDADGNLFIADSANNRIRRVDASTGIITTVAGSGVFGFSGDGGPATDAGLRGPARVALDVQGNLFIADSANHRIRRVDASTGIITTVAGNGTTGVGGDGGQAINAGLREPLGVAVDAQGNLAISHGAFDNRRLRRVNAATGVISTVAGLTRTLGPVAVDAAGHLFVAEGDQRMPELQQRIRRVDAVTGTVSTVAGGGSGADGGPALGASLTSPWGLGFDASGSLFITQRSIPRRVRRVDVLTGTITTVAGNGTAGFSGDGGPATDASLFTPSQVAVDASGNLFVSDLWNNRVRRVDASTGIITTVAGNGTAGFAGDGGLATSASLGGPNGLTFDAAGNLLVAAEGRVRRVDAFTGIITTVAGGGVELGDGGPATDASLGLACDVALDRADNLFISDAAGQRVRRVDASTGIITTVAGNGTIGSGPIGDGGPATSASLFAPCSLAVDADGHLFISDVHTNRIRRVDSATGIINTVAGGGAALGDGGPATSASVNPSGLAMNANGDLFIAEAVKNRIRRVDGTTGIISTIAGNGVFGFSGDDGPAVEARLATPVGVALGNGIFIADSGNHRVRRVILNQPPVADAGPDHTLIVGESATFDGSSSSDPDGTIDRYAWDFGDGGSGTGVMSTNTYAAAGTFTAVLTVTDDEGATGSDTAQVTVVTSAQAVGVLAEIVRGYDLEQGLSNSLDRKLARAREAMGAAGQGQDAVHKLQAFIHEVEAQRDKRLTSAQADELVGWALRIIGGL